MNVIRILNKEHELILEFLDQLSKAAKLIFEEQNPSREFLELTVEFARHFADKFHHFKEEYIMFGVLAQKKEGSLLSLIERLRQQHEQGRNYIQEISESTNGYDKDLDSAIRTVHRNLKDYVTNLRRHIDYEDKTFFPIAEKELTAEELENLLSEFNKVDKKLPEYNIEKSRNIVERMKALLEN
ncbi:MAG: hypothetical protein GY839_02710 [candidate division Zixibacteria bacterium]|nr:hypothetical protein [candidate division Zixibacteria bacterium]